MRASWRTTRKRKKEWWEEDLPDGCELDSRVVGTTEHHYRGWSAPMDSSVQVDNVDEMIVFHFEHVLVPTSAVAIATDCGYGGA